MNPVKTQFVRYSGRSMWPGFQDGDVLEVQPVAIGLLRCGDNIVFRDPAGCQLVHRVVTAGSAIRTRGDALLENDCFDVSEEQLVGKVIRRYRLGEERRVHGGWRGRWLGRGYHLASRLNPMRPSRGGRLARLVRGTSMQVLGGFWPRGEIREVHLSGQPPVVVWYWGKRPIGRQDWLSGGWSIYWPWCVFITPAQRQRPPALSGES